MLNWYAVYVNVKHEKKVVQKLQEQHIEAYTPISRKLQQWSDRKKWVEFPMLSGYVFVKINLSEKEKVLNCPGIFAFIKFDGVEAKIRDTEIAILKSIEMNGYDVNQEAVDLKILDEVEITEGPFKGLKGTIVHLKNMDYVQIQLESLRQSITVKLPQQILKKRIILN
ncbi:MAG: UpxY family transcription antiterminator [Bacteroidetes bacterium]|nr:UpxY family transcription antiterminator [Bacteroidota bacterium]